MFLVSSGGCSTPLQLEARSAGTFICCITMTLMQHITLNDLQHFKKEILLAIKQALREERSSAPQLKDQWLKTHQVRRLLGISPTTLHMLRKKEILPFTKLNGVYFYLLDDINAILHKYKNRKDP